MNGEEILAEGQAHTAALIDAQQQAAVDAATQPLQSQIDNMSAQAILDAATISQLRRELESKDTLFGAYCGPDRYPNTGPVESKAQMRARITGLLGKVNVERIFNMGSWGVPSAGTPTILSFDQDPTAVAAGTLDTQLDNLLAGLKANGDICYLSIQHECDKAGGFPGAEMVPAYRHIQARRDAIGATNVKVGPILMSWTQYTNPAKVDTYCWDGMDFLGFDAYFRPGGAFPLRTPEQVYGPLVAKAQSLGVPLVIGETSMGAQGAGGGFTDAEWATTIPQAVAYLTGRAAAVAFFFTNKSDGDWRLTPHPDALAAWRSACMR